MSKFWLVRSLLTVVAMLPLAGTMPGQAQEQWLEHRCVAPPRFKIRLPGQFWARESAICAARTQEALLLLTGLMLDRAALSAATGVDEAQVALGIKRTLAERIAELRAAVEGLGSGTSSTSEVIVTEIAAESSELALELKRRQEGGLDDAAKAHLEEAQRHLHEVSYYGSSAMVGGKRVSDFMRSGRDKSTLLNALNSPRIGFGSDFAKQVPERAAKVPSIFTETVALRATIRLVVADPDKDAKAGEERAKKQAKEDGERVQAGLESFSIPLTPAKDTQ